MSDEKITVEWIATANQMLGTIQKIDQRMEKQEKLMQKLGDTSKKSAKDAANSFNALEKELKDNEAALKRMERGTKEFDDQRRKVDGLRASVRNAKTEIGSMANTSQSGFAQMKTSILGPTAAALALVVALKAVADAQRAIVSGGADAAVSLDTLARQMQIQASLTDPQREVASRQVLKQASVAGVTAETGFRTATQLVSSGFQKPIESGTLTKALEAMQATNFKGSPEEFVQGMSEVLASYKLDKTADNFEKIAVAMQGLFKQTDFQLVEGKDFAKNASVFEAAGISMEESLAAFAALREVLPAEQAGTGLRNMTTILQGAAGQNEQKTALESLGIKPQEVDFIGENLGQVMERLKKGLDSVDAETKQLAMIKLFGRENIASATLMVGQTARVKELQGLQGNKAQFQADVATKQEGMEAERNRIANQEILNRLPIASQINDLNNRIQRAEDANKAAVERAAVSDIPGLGPAAQVAAKIDNAVGVMTRPEIGSGLGDALSATLGGWFKKNDANQQEQIRLQQEANAIAVRQAAGGQRPAAPPQARPRDAPKPGALIP